MIHYIKGVVTEIMPGKLVIENNGIGYEVFVSDATSSKLAAVNDEVKLYTFMAVKEDDVSLYGFRDSESLNMFRQLVTVSGIGNKGAMSILSKLTVKELKQAIVYDDPNTIATAPGIGKKTAAKLVLELKDKIGDIEFAEVPSAAVSGRSSAKSEALSALTSLGFSRSEAMAYLSGIKDDNLSAEEYIRLALKARR